MEKTIFFTTLMLFNIILHAQNPYKQGSFVIQGKVKGYTEPTFEFDMSTYLKSVTNSVVVKPDGTFSQSFPVQHRQDIYLLLNNEMITFAVYDGDTIRLNWDNQDVQKTLRIEGKNRNRSNELAVEKLITWQVRRDLYRVLDSLSKIDGEMDDQFVNIALNRFYKKEVQLILDAAAGKVTNHFDYLLTNAYFQYVEWMGTEYRSELRYTPRLQTGQKKNYPIFSIADTASAPELFPTFNTSWWRNIPSYRNYFYGYIRSYQPQDGSKSQTATTEHATYSSEAEDDYSQAMATAIAQEKLPQFFALREIRQGDKYITNVPMREWYKTKVVMDGFGYYSFEDTEKAYQSIIGKLTSPYLRDTLEKFYMAIQRLKPGNPAPAFSLQDEKGKSVSLADFKGKVVYINFWGVSCGPCIDEIKNSVPQLHQRYAGKDVVFLNICVDAKGKQWTDALRKYSLGGVNLYAEGWAENPVCKDYNVSSVPHYVLIDKAGNIVNNRAPRASQLLYTDEGRAIDVLLK